MENGLAYPAFYNSMSADEINVLRAAGSVARAKNTLLWKHLTGKIAPLNVALVFRGKGATPDPHADQGPVILPKLFRRLVNWTIAKKGKIPSTPSTFRKSLESAGLSDAFYLTDDFLVNTALSADLHTLPEFLDANATFTLNPDDLVFRESSSTLIGPDNQPVTDWD